MLWMHLCRSYQEGGLQQPELPFGLFECTKTWAKQKKQKKKKKKNKQKKLEFVADFCSLP